MLSLKRGSELLGFTEQAYHQALRHARQQSVYEVELRQAVEQLIVAYRADMPRLGGEKLWFMSRQQLSELGFNVGRDKFVSLYAELGFCVKKRKKTRRTTDSSAWQRQFEDLRKGLIPSYPEQLVVADITFIETEEEEVAYMPLITDAYSKFILGYEGSARMRSEDCLVALNMAINNRRYKHICIHHSDRGSQYISKTYTEVLNKHQFVSSTTQDGSPYDNPVAERVNRIIKEEFGFDGKTQKIKNVKHAKELLKKAVYIYNYKRPHLSNQMLTPSAMHQQDKTQIKTWTKKKKDS